MENTHTQTLIGGYRAPVQREVDRLIKHLSRKPNDETARARLLDCWEKLGVTVVRGDS